VEAAPDLILRERNLEALLDLQTILLWQAKRHAGDIVVRLH
jgi:hypothetical protein